MKQNRNIIIGITGSSGSGKTTVSKILTTLGAHVIDADKIAHEILLPGGAAVSEVTELLGTAVLDNAGGIDRPKTAQIVFADKNLLQKHTEITHKYIIKEIKDQIDDMKSSESIIVIDAPLLVESGLNLICDMVWLVSASKELRLSRVMERDSLMEQDVDRRFKSQTPESTLRKYADAVIENTGDKQDLKEQVVDLFNRIEI